ASSMPTRKAGFPSRRVPRRSGRTPTRRRRYSTRSVSCGATPRRSRRRPPGTASNRAGGPGSKTQERRRGGEHEAKGETSPVRRVEHSAPFRLPVRNREFLAGSAHENFPESVPDVGEMIPTLAASQADCPHPVLVAVVREVIDEMLPEFGGLLLRGLPLADKAGFERGVTGLGDDRIGYQGGIAVRENDSGGALNASQEERRITLSPDNREAY